MTYAIKAVNEQVHIFARWDETWKSYNNCYLVSTGDRRVMIDCGKAEHAAELLEALRELGLAPEDITHLLATHGHKDHVGAYTLFSRASMYIHPADRERLTAGAQQRFSLDAPDDGMLLDFSCVRLNHHTPGSVAFFHHPSGTLLVGDHLCFFGEALPDDGLVSAGSQLRERARAFVAGWAQNPEDRSRYRFDDFLEGLKTLQRFPSLALCTGHGGVLTGDIQEFLGDLVSLAQIR